MINLTEEELESVKILMKHLKPVDDSLIKKSGMKVFKVVPELEKRKDAFNLDMVKTGNDRDVEYITIYAKWNKFNDIFDYSAKTNLKFTNLDGRSYTLRDDDSYSIAGEFKYKITRAACLAASGLAINGELMI